MDVNYRNIGDKSNIQVTCGPTGLYRLAVTRGGQVITRQQSPDGRFSFDLGKGNYSIGCLRDGETSVKPQCQKTIKIEDRPDGNCTMISSVRYGGAPLRTQLSCENSSNNNCIMEIYRNGKLGKTIHSCQSNMTLSQK